jgi:cupin fold WbuC family metalloprotein
MGAEMMVAVRGLMVLVTFDDMGKIQQVQQFGAGLHSLNPHVAVGAETPPGKWHTVVSIESGSVLLEVKAGPFNPRNPKYLAPWAPLEGTDEGAAYLVNLKKTIV